MDILYLNDKIIHNKRLNKQYFIDGKIFYHNPFNSGELLAIYPPNADYLELDNRLNEFGQIGCDVEGAVIPIQKVYLDDKLRGFTLQYVKDAYDLNSVKNEFDCNNATKLLFLRRLNSVLSGLHKYDIVSKDLNPSNLLFDGNNKPYIIDLVDSKVGHIPARCCALDLCLLYNRDYKYLEDTPYIDNANMHINLLYLLLSENDFRRCLYGSIDDYNRVINAMHLNNEVSDTLKRVKRIELLNTIPSVSHTIDQII